MLAPFPCSTPIPDVSNLSFSENFLLGPSPASTSLQFSRPKAAAIVIPPSPPAEIEPLSVIMHRLELASAEIHNVRLRARNARDPCGKLELLEKTIEGSGVELANAIKGLELDVSEPLQPAKLRDRPKIMNATSGRLEDYTEQDVLDLIIFYNNDFGIVPADGEEARRDKLLTFLTQH